MKTLKSIFIPFKSLNKSTFFILLAVEVLFVVVLWQSMGCSLIPKPMKILESLVYIFSSKIFFDNLISSVWLTLKGMFYSIFISLLVAYLSRLPLFKPMVAFVVKCRYLTLTGLIFLFTLLTKDGHQLKISLLIFGIVPFFVTSLLSIFDNIDMQEFELCKTLRMNNFQTLWEIIIVGRLDQVFEVMRQNFAISWMMITMVEGLNMSEGGLGTMLIKANKYVDLSSVFAILLIILVLGVFFDFLLSKTRLWLFPYCNK